MRLLDAEGRPIEVGQVVRTIASVAGTMVEVSEVAKPHPQDPRVMCKTARMVIDFIVPIPQQMPPGGGYALSNITIIKDAEKPAAEKTILQ